MKLRYFYKIDHKKQPIPGSNVRRKSTPGKQWIEILSPCCSPIVIDGTGGPRYFVQLDGYGKPVDGTLIKRPDTPKMEEGIKYYELDWKSPCCRELTWVFYNLGSTGSFKIYVNGVERVNTIMNDQGSFHISPGDEIHIVNTNTGFSSITNYLNISGSYTYTSTDTPINDITFTYNGGLNLNVQATIQQDGE